MEPYSSVDQRPLAPGTEPAGGESFEPNLEQEIREEEVREENVQERTSRGSQTSISAALAASRAEASATLAAGVRFPGEDAGCSLAEMAHRDLDAALQLLADRAQYITGSSGAAIALRRDGRNDMLCRASTGANAPELGALLSTEFGLSGESVRTRQALRCDDADRDARVNREVCQQLGIASVVVMPVVNDDEVLGVFELFSGKVNAFGERDVSALQRLSEMVETAVKLALAAESLPERFRAATVPGEIAVGQVAGGEVSDHEVSDDEVIDHEVLAGQFVGDALLTVREPEIEEQVLEVEAEVEPEALAPAMSSEPLKEMVAEATAEAQAAPQESPAPAKPEPVKKPLFWSAATQMSAEASAPVEADQSHVPPVLRNLRKCEACGFPVSAGRVLCVECEEKKWRGQLRVPRAVASAGAPVERAFAAAAQSAGITVSRAVPSVAPLAPPREPAEAAIRVVRTDLIESKRVDGKIVEVESGADSPITQPEKSGSEPAELILSAGLEPSQSWIAANKYILGAMLVVAAAVAGVLLLR